MIVDVLLPALNEEGALPLVLADLAASGAKVRRVVVVDNGSTDRTAQVAREAGATVVSQPARGYGSACLAGLLFLSAQEPPPDVVVFLDADRADDAREIGRLIEAAREHDLVIGSRVLGGAEKGALQPAQRMGNFLSVNLIWLLYGQKYTDLGPFRAVRFDALRALAMNDRDYGWTVEMQVKAARLHLRVAEVPVSYRRRAAGKSKVSATVRGTVGAGYKILYTIFRHALSR